MQKQNNSLDVSDNAFFRGPGPHRKWRHIYCCMAKATPYHFRFSVSSAALRDPNAFGRPVGIFNADCYGTTPLSLPGLKVKQSEDPNTARRFPLATAFTTKEAAALECDFWKLVLRTKFFLEIAWSHESFAVYQEAARAKGLEPMDMVYDESQWSAELLDFIDQHQAKLLEHRDMVKPELDLDAWLRVANEKNNGRLRAWVEGVRATQAELDAVIDTENLSMLSKRLNNLRGLNLPYTTATERISEAIRCAAADCDQLVRDTVRERTRLTAALQTLIDNRPCAELEPGEEPTVFFQSEGV